MVYNPLYIGIIRAYEKCAAIPECPLPDLLIGIEI